MRYAAIVRVSHGCPSSAPFGVCEHWTEQHGLRAGKAPNTTKGGVDNARRTQYACDLPVCRHGGRRTWQVRLPTTSQYVALPGISDIAAPTAWSVSIDRMIDFSDCTLEPLHEDGELILHRAVHASPADGVVPSVLTVGPAGEYASPGTLARLEHECVMTLGELSASIAHEVTQPLAAIVTNGDACVRLLAGDQPNLGETRKAVASIIRDARRAAEVVARVRALVKKSDVVRTPLDLGQLIREVLVLVQPGAAAHRIVLLTSLADELPPVLGDRIQLQQVLLNLLTNAIEAMREVVDRRRKLVISARRHDAGPDAGVLVAVEDAGVGFEQASVDRLFEALYTTKPEGLGMGLSISRSIIQSHGGRLWATPNMGYGATFQFVLPAGKS